MQQQGWLGRLPASACSLTSFAPSMHAFLLFIFFNGTVVFATGSMRWLGLCLCFGLCVVWWNTARNNSSRQSDDHKLTVVEN